MAVLINTMTWEQICDTYATDYISHNTRKRRYTKEQYYEWMLAQRNFSPNGYKDGMFFNKSLYHYCFSVYMKTRHTKQHHVTLILGETGKGKSRLGLKIAALTDPDFCMKRIITVPLELIPVLLSSKRGHAVQVDEGINVLCSQDAISTLGKAMNKIVDLIRNYGYHWIICIPSIHDLPKRIREQKKFISAIILKEEKLKAKTDYERYRNYRFYGKSVMQKIQDLVKEGENPFKRPLKHLKGSNTIEIPLLNDITDEAYELKKRGDADIVLSNIQAELQKKFSYQTEMAAPTIGQAVAAENKQGVVYTEGKRQVGKEILNRKYVDIKEICDQIGYKRVGIIRMIKRGQLEGINLGNRWKIPLDAYEKLLNPQQLEIKM
jgi:hypothetical protein